MDNPYLYRRNITLYFTLPNRCRLCYLPLALLTDFLYLINTIEDKTFPPFHFPPSPFPFRRSQYLWRTPFPKTSILVTHLDEDYNGVMDDGSRFIAEEIEVLYDQLPALEKKPGCPAGFIWRGESYEIVDMISEWHDYRRRGRMARNMQPLHAAAAENRGSWGVGRDYYRVRTREGRIFELYFDRAPKDADRRKGAWFLFRELVAGDG